MSAFATGALLAVAASVLLNGSYLLQHAGSQAAPAVTMRRPLATLGGLLRSRWWVAGLGAGLAGWGLHVAALSVAPLSVVQAVVAGGLALTVPAAALAFGERLSRSEQVALVAMIAGLTLLAVVAGASPTAAIRRPPMAAYLAGAVALAGLLAATRSGPGRSRALAAAGGVLYGAADAATKALMVERHAGAGPVALWLGLALVLSAGAFLCFQRGLQLGPAVPVVALMTAATNAVAVLGGLVVFHDALGGTAAAVVAHLAGFVFIAVAGWRLAAAQTRLVE